MEQKSYLRFWGKARPADEGGPTWHPVAYHLLDVAASIEALLAARPVARARAARLLALPEEEAAQWLVVMASLHDLGKFARPFQAKCPEYWPPALGPFDPNAAILRPHTDDGALIWMEHLRDWLGARWPVPPEVDRPIMAAVFGHHGRPLPLDWGDWQRYFGNGGQAAAECCAADLIALLGSPTPACAGLEGDKARHASWWIAGMISLADWVGSHQEWFPYRGMTPEKLMDLGEYWTLTRGLARQAVASAGLRPPKPSRARAFEALTGRTSPTPMQAWAQSVLLPDGPVLAIIEDVTGAGKTEAAQVLIHRLMVAGRAGGAYWGMPTQATANAMYQRQAEGISRLFANGSKPTLILAHGQSALHAPFQRSIRRTPDQEWAADLGAGELSASAACTAFLAEDRRASLLADVGAGTVDQALLAILPSKFNTVRLAGLAEKVLVLDEIHAFDAYMGVEAERLLTFQAALGGSAVLLSATLPSAVRRRLIEAWDEGLRQGRPRHRPRLGEPDPVESPLSGEYPLATLVSAGGCKEFAKEAAATSRRVTRIALVHSFEEAGARVLAAAAAGGAAAWIRNTVDDCLRAASWLRSQGAAPIVFHARFAQGDRQEREAEVLRRFGPALDSPWRTGSIVVATQVIEQSLDLDFDAMLTDLAPMDLVIQRAGRFRRHAGRSRPAGVPEELVVFCPAVTDAPPDSWLTGDFKGTEAVYKEPLILWRTARLLAEHRELRVPEGLRELVENCYAEDTFYDAALPEGLRVRSDKALAARFGDASTAHDWVLPLARGYTGAFQAWLNDTRVPTRLGDAQTTLRLASLGGGRVRPWVTHEQEWRGWALSEVKVRAWKVPPDAKPDPRFAKVIAAARDAWGEYEQDIPVLVLEPSGENLWSGALLTQRGKRVEVVYSREDGLGWGAAPKPLPEEAE
ncbi:MAG: CRISPR-associated helicase Cas3' [Gemmatimonadetes bacterium]|nr:CRISPR-associated helicase Cas3' [Gemmatimonadota bacterium]